MRRVQGTRTTDECDSAMAEGTKMFDALSYALVVVHFQQADVRAIGALVHEDKGHIAFCQLVEQRLLDAESHDRYGIRLTLDHATDA